MDGMNLGGIWVFSDTNHVQMCLFYGALFHVVCVNSFICIEQRKKKGNIYSLSVY